MGMDLEPKFDKQITESHLITYFATRPNNFQLERFLASGAGANAWLVRYRKQAGDRWGRIVLKTPLGISAAGYDEDPFDVGFGVEEFKAEREILNAIRTRHLVKLVQFSHAEDPLKQDGPRDFFQRWIYLEYLQHGTLGEFTRKCTRHGIPHLPNRLLWRIFLCLIRACIAMAYVPDVPVDRYDENEEPCALNTESVSYSHNDMHSDNIMIGDMLSDPDDVEHFISPVIKFIDLESCAQYTGGEGKGVQRNLEKVAENMMELILLESTYDLDLDLGGDGDQRGQGGAETDNSVWFEPGWYHDGFATAAKPLLPNPDAMVQQMPAPWLDPDLRRLLCECTAVDVRKRPRLRNQLLPEVLEAVEQRDADYYREEEYCVDADAEEDVAVLRLVQRVLGAAPPPPPGTDTGTGEGEEEGEGPESMQIDEPTAAESSGRRDRDGRSASPESSGERLRRLNFRAR
ncbi:hypothetical protein PG984_000054 [Apiospora sp. TS-2023a]